MLFIPKPAEGWGWEDPYGGFLLTNCVSLPSSGITMTGESTGQICRAGWIAGDLQRYHGHQKDVHVPPAFLIWPPSAFHTDQVWWTWLSECTSSSLEAHFGHEDFVLTLFWMLCLRFLRFWVESFVRKKKTDMIHDVPVPPFLQIKWERGFLCHQNPTEYGMHISFTSFSLMAVLHSDIHFDHCLTG